MVHLHTHTKYSLLDSTNHIEPLINKVKELGQTALAITDHGNMYGVVEFYQAALAAGIKPIIGCEVYVTNDLDNMKRDNSQRHLILLQKNETGRLNLQKIVTESTKHIFNKRPHIDFNMLERHHEGLVCLSACMAGEVSRALLDNDEEEATRIATQYKELFGDDYYIEYQAHEDPVQQDLNLELIHLAEKLNIKYVVTCDIHYLTPEEQKYHRIFVQIAANHDAGEIYNDCYVQSEEEVLSKCMTTKEYNKIAIANTHEIADKCNVEYPLSAPIIPHTEIPKNFKSEKDYLKYLCNKGLKEKGFFSWTLEEWQKYMQAEVYDENGCLHIKEFMHIDSVEQIQKVYKDRAKYELDAVTKMGFEGYYLLVHSYISSAQRRGIARGSAGGSLLAYLCGIVDIDPIKYGLYFERFIDVGALELLETGQITNKELKIPDVDADFSPKDRDKVMNDIVNTYGMDNVVMLGTFGYLKAKSSLKDIGKILGLSFEFTNSMTKKLDNDTTIDEALSLGLLDEYLEQCPDLFDYASHLAGLPKSRGVHACFKAGTLVTTNNGLVEIQNIQVGDMVLTHLGNYKYVAKTTVTDTQTVYTVKSYGALNIECTGNHKFFIRHRIKSRYRKYAEPVWVEAKDIIKSDMMCIPINTISEVPIYKNLDFTNKNLWWIIGRYIGDGWCEYFEQSRNEKRVIICCSNVSDIELNEIISKLNNLIQFRYEKVTTTYKIHLLNNELFEYLQRFGKYADKKRLTSDIFNLPINLLESFIQGYLSADGYLNKRGDYQLKTVSKQLAQGLSICVNKVYHKYCTFSVLEPHQDIIEGRVVNAKEKYLVEFNPKKTKRDKGYFDEKNNCLWIYVKSVTENNENIPMYNLSVLDDNSYTVNAVGVHNCGRIICMKNADYYNALEYNSDEDKWVLQGDMHTADDLGLVKIDLLGLRTLDALYDVMDMVGLPYDFISPHKMDLNDKETWKQWSEGNSLLTFQFESTGMRHTLKEMGCNSIDDLTAANALYRPGSKEYIPNYIARKKGLEPITYINDELQSILSDTYGIIVYQEQLIEIGRLAGLKNPDQLRKATAKKKPKLMAEIEPKLKNGLMNRGWTQQQVDTLWDDILKFAKYSFNKSHSAAYALTAYITMYFKVHYPVEYITATINSFDGKADKIIGVIEEAKRIGVKCRFDTWNNIKSETLCKDGVVYLGINTIKGLGQNAADVLDKYRDKKYDSFIDFLADNDIPKKQLEIMIKLDLFKEFGHINQLLKETELFNFIYNKKELTIAKFETYGIPEYFIEKHCKRITSKKAKEFNDIEMIKDITSHYKYEATSFTEKLLYEQEYLGYVNLIVSELSDKYYWVLEINENKIKMYQLCTGNTTTIKVRKKVFNNNSFEVNNLLKVTNIASEKKWGKDENGDWYRIDEYEDILAEYIVIK